jgi:hypothetical protein
MSTKLTFSAGEIDHNVPLAFSDIIDFTLIHPGTDYSMPNSRHMHGVFFRSQTAGTFNVITLNAYMNNGGAAYRAQSGGPSTAEKAAVIAAVNTASENITIQLLAGQWTDTPIAWIDATNAADLVLNIGLY